MRKYICFDLNLAWTKPQGTGKSPHLFPVYLLGTGHNIAPAFTNLNQIIHEIKSCQILLHNMVKGIIPVALQQQHNLISYIISSAKLDRIQRSTLCSI